MTDLATNRDYRSTLKMMKGKLTYLLKLYPIQPLATNIPKKKKSTANGVLAACWCRPPNKFPCRCPLTNQHQPTSGLRNKECHSEVDGLSFKICPDSSPPGPVRSYLAQHDIRNMFNEEAYEQRVIQKSMDSPLKSALIRSLLVLYARVVHNMIYEIMINEELQRLVFAVVPVKTNSQPYSGTNSIVHFESFL